LRHWQTAWDRAATLYDTGGHNIILNVADSLDWQENFTAKYSLVGAGNFYIIGNRAPSLLQSAQVITDPFVCKTTCTRGITALNGAPPAGAL